MTDQLTQKWSIKRAGLFGFLFGIAYGIVRLSWGAGDNPSVDNTAQAGGFLLGYFVGAGIAASLLIMVIVAIRNLIVR